MRCELVKRELARREPVRETKGRPARGERVRIKKSAGSAYGEGESAKTESAASDSAVCGESVSSELPDPHPDTRSSHSNPSISSLTKAHIKLHSKNYHTDTQSPRPESGDSITDTDSRGYPVLSISTERERTEERQKKRGGEEGGIEEVVRSRRSSRPTSKRNDLADKVGDWSANP